MLAGAQRELAGAGDPGAQLAAFEQQMRAGGVDALMNIRASLDAMSRQIAEMRANLPDAQASVAFPVDAYPEMRRVFDCPPPRADGAGLSVAVVLLADREPLERLYAQVSSVSAQTHGRWSLRAIGADPDRRAIIERAAVRDRRIAWIEAAPEDRLAVLEVEAGLATQADWVLLLSPGARLHRHALSWIAATAAETGARAVIIDEETGDLDEDPAPLKPTFRHIADRHSILEANVYGETLAVAAEALRSLPHLGNAGSIAEARSRLLVPLIEGRRVAHVPLPLVRTCHAGPTEPDDPVQAHAAAVRAHLANTGEVSLSVSPWSPAVLQVLRAPVHPDTPLAVIVPTKDNSEDIEALVESLVSLAHRPKALEILIVNNGRPTPEDPAMARLASRERVAVMEMPEPFNWSRFNNLAAAATRAPYLVFVNDDMLMLSQDWDKVVRSFLERDDVGALGARLHYADNTVQHAGILFDWRGSVIHDGLHRPADDGGPARRWHVTRAVSAVTGAFLATRRTDYDAVGGFDETHLPVSYSDIDYALKLRARGLEVVWTPMVSLHHYESKSRGLDHLSPAKAARNNAERRIVEAAMARRVRRGAQPQTRSGARRPCLIG